MGHLGEARNVAVERQERQRKGGKIALSARPFHWLYGLLVGYGYKPVRLLSVMIAVWLACALVYWLAVNPGFLGLNTPLLAPVTKKPDVILIFDWPPSLQDIPLNAPSIADNHNFVPLVYSLDVLMPVVNLGYKATWQPVVCDSVQHPIILGQIVQFIYWFEIFFGWTSGVLLIGVLGNLIKKD